MTRDITPSLMTNGLSLSRGGPFLFQKLDLSLRAGHVLLLEGPNGSGKSSLLRVLAGLLPADAGALDIDGEIGWLGHENALSPDRILRSELQFWLGTVPPSDVDDFGMSRLLDTPLHMLSQGQRRRAALWRLAAGGAHIWLMDEPAAGLDADNRTILTDALLAHRARGGIAVIATHGDIIVDDASVLRLGDALPTVA
ncbi:MAG: heme ABC exporter ATP-binding protein CcmA [Pacificimonas sp.]